MVAEIQQVLIPMVTSITLIPMISVIQQGMTVMGISILPIRMT